MKSIKLIKKKSKLNNYMLTNSNLMLFYQKKQVLKKFTVLKLYFFKKYKDEYLKKYKEKNQTHICTLNIF